MATQKRKLPKHIYKRRRLAFTMIVTLLVVAIIATFVGFIKPQDPVTPEDTTSSAPESGNKRTTGEEPSDAENTKGKGSTEEPVDTEKPDEPASDKESIGSLEADNTELLDILSTADATTDGEAEPAMALLSTTADQSPNKAPTTKPKVTVEIADWRTLLVNNKTLLPSDFTIETVKVGGHEVDSRIERELVKMIMAAKADGVNLKIVSGYRSVETQQQVYDKKIQEYNNSGYSETKGKEYTEMYISVPGYSEHHTGLAVDIMTPSYSTMNSGFAKTAAAKWLKENAADYGFILRYPEGKEKVTGFAFEPWHYRFVGVSTAQDIMNKGITLEEYFYLQQEQTEEKTQEVPKTDEDKS